jgi:hypothetical protein
MELLNVPGVRPGMKSRAGSGSVTEAGVEKRDERMRQKRPVSEDRPRSKKLRSDT